jgi:predicted transcriptional regulator
VPTPQLKPGKRNRQAESSARGLATAERHREWIELRRQGVLESEIAKRHGVTQQAVSKAVLKHVRNLPAAEAERLKRTQLEQINSMREMALQAYEQASSDEARLGLLNTMLKLEERTAKLLGLDAEYRIKRRNGSAVGLAATQLLARAEPLDLELLKQIQELDPIVKPAPPSR